MMMVQLTTDCKQEVVAEKKRRCIVLMDFRKAYDIVDRDFMYLTLCRFGYYKRFIKPIRWINTGTTARFIVNGDHLMHIPVLSRIRQGFPLAPFLFLLVVEILGSALQHDPKSLWTTRYQTDLIYSPLFGLRL